MKLFQKCSISRSLWKTFLIKCSKIFVKKALAFILQSLSLKLLEMPRIDCYVVRRIPENFAGRDAFRNFAGLQQWVYVKILFNIFLSFGWIFFQRAPVGCFYWETSWPYINSFLDGSSKLLFQWFNNLKDSDKLKQ